MESDQEVSKANIVDLAKNFVFLIAPVGIAIGCLNLYAFWSEFNVNVFQYASVGDVVSTALVPLALIVFLNVLSSVIGYKHGQSSGLANHSAGEFKPPLIVRFAMPLLIIFLIFSIVFLIVFWNKKWLVIPVIAYLTFLRFTTNAEFEFFPGISSGVQKLIASLLILIGLYSYGVGILSANYIIDGERYNYVTKSSNAELSRDSIDMKSKIRFVGHVGEFDFFYDPEDSSVKIAKVQDENIMSLKKYEMGRLDILKVRLRKWECWIRGVYLGSLK